MTDAVTPSLRRSAAPFVTLIALILLALVIGAGIVLLSGHSPVLALQELIQGAVSTRTNIGATLTRSIPIILSALAASIAFRAGLFNLGLEGQMVIGALTSAITANALQFLPPVILLPLVLLSGAVAGGLWALPPAWWQTRFQVPVLITTLLLNYIAALTASYLVNFPLRDVSSGGAVPQTVMIPDAIRLGVVLTGTRLHAGIVFVIVLPLVVGWFFQRTSLGYEFRMTGLNPDFAAAGGIRTARITLLAMFTSGAVVGLAGAIQVLGVDFRYIDGALATAGFAWTGFIAAILGASHPLAIIGAGLFLAGLKVGAAGMQRNTQIPLQIADVVQAGAIFVAAIRLKVGTVIKRFLVPSEKTSL